MHVADAAHEVLTSKPCAQAHVHVHVHVHQRQDARLARFHQRACPGQRN